MVKYWTQLICPDLQNCERNTSLRRGLDNLRTFESQWHGFGLPIILSESLALLFTLQAEFDSSNPLQAFSSNWVSGHLAADTRSKADLIVYDCMI